MANIHGIDRGYPPNNYDARRQQQHDEDPGFLANFG